MRSARACASTHEGGTLKLARRRKSRWAERSHRRDERPREVQPLRVVQPLLLRCGQRFRWSRRPKEQPTRSSQDCWWLPGSAMAVEHERRRRAPARESAPQYHRAARIAATPWFVAPCTVSAFRPRAGSRHCVAGCLPCSVPDSGLGRSRPSSVPRAHPQPRRTHSLWTTSSSCDPTRGVRKASRVRRRGSRARRHRGGGHGRGRGSPVA
jgi:hypothetical protein